jgi:transcription elongation factor Elf1
MGRPKEPNQGTVPCLVCGNRYDYLVSEHLSSSNCHSEFPNDIEQYRTWVQQEYDLEDDDPIFDKNQIQKPQHYREHAERLDLPE